MDIISLKPKGTPDFMVPAWLGCLSWAIGSDDVRTRFTQETGERLVSNSPIEQMIDKATGYQDHVITQFVLWVNENIWGTMDEEEGGDFMT